MSQVNIVVTSKGVVVNPTTVHINRVDQNITWNLAGGSWEPNGIVMDMNPPAGFQPWPGPQPALVGNNYVVNAGDPLPPGASMEMYRYTINIRDNEGNVHSKVISAENPEISIDPDVENDPTP